MVGTTRDAALASGRRKQSRGRICVGSVFKHFHKGLPSIVHFFSTTPRLCHFSRRQLFLPILGRRQRSFAAGFSWKGKRVNRSIQRYDSTVPPTIPPRTPPPAG